MPYSYAWILMTALLCVAHTRAAAAAAAATKAVVGLQGSRVRYTSWHLQKRTGGRLHSSPCTAARMASSLPEHVHYNRFLAPGLPVLDGSGPVALVLLNVLGSGSQASQQLRSVWAAATLRLCADGGANRLHDVFDEEERSGFVPDVIKGDLDSLRPDVAAFYKERGTDIMEAHSQDHNDFEKCILELQARAGSDAASTTVVVLGAFGGRFDQEMAAFHLLHKYTASFQRFVLLGAGNLR
jgi:Thiamin pyrophosphokinase, catalytic domain